MCGRYLLDDEAYADIFASLIEFKQSPVAGAIVGAAPGAALGSTPGAALGSTLGALAALARGEVFPTNIAPVIAGDGPMAAKWGFPRWKGAGVIINARAETAFEKSMFRRPLLERRCVVPSNGFYEWSHVGGQKKKDKFLLRVPGERVLFMAGMMSIFPGADGNDYSAFVILTTNANESVSTIHDRMPVILAPDERDRWLRDGAFMESALHRAGPALALEMQ